MRMANRSALVVGLLLACPGSVAAAVNQQAIDGVAAGRIKVAKASWWGFSAEESTKALQQAINSGAEKVIVEKMGSPWIVDRIRLAGNQVLVFEEGVEVVAKRGAFKGPSDALFSGGGIENITLRGYGAVLRMWRSDYDGPEYEKAEWRHVLRFGNCTNVRVYGLTLAESGGDGIYLGDSHNRNVHIKDVVCDRNYRQGISVITAENLLIEDCTLSNTAGTPPKCGIDFEPNSPRQRLVNCVMRNCVTKNNASTGYTVAIGSTAEPLSLRFENCRSIADGNAGASLDLPNDPEGFKGRISFVDCRFEGNTGVGIVIKGNAAGGCRVTFEKCSILDPVSENPKATPIVMIADRGNSASVGSVDFGEMVVRGPANRRPISFADMAGVGLRDVSGTLLVERDGKTEKVVITDKLIAEWMPAAVIKEIPRLTLEGLSLQPVADRAAAPPDALRSAVFRGKHELLLQAKRGDTVTMRVDFRQLANYGGKTMPVSVVSPSGLKIDCPGTAFKKTTDTGFQAPETGIYRLSLTSGTNLMAVLSSTHPLLISGEDSPIHLLNATGTFFFWVPAGTRRFGVRVSGEGVGEAVRAALLDPAGDVVEEVDNAAAHQFEVELPEPSPGRAWGLVLSKPTRIILEDQHIDLRGIPPLLGGSKEGLLRPE